MSDISNPSLSSLAAAFKDAGQIKTSKIKGSKTSEKIKNLPAKHVAIKAAAQRVSRRLMIAANNELLTCVCDVTGIVSILNIPAIPSSNLRDQKVLIWSSPLASLDNCRGIAQAGESYLQKLDTQTLAGILIVLADHYDLFRYQPSDSGAQKNAIIRTAGKDVIINTILLTEDWINSSSIISVPKLSLIMDTIVEEGGIAIRMTEWLKEVTAILYLPLDRRSNSEEDFYSEVPFKQMTPDYIIKARRANKEKDKESKSANWAKTNAIWAAQREFKADKKVAKDLILAFSKASPINPKLKGLLTSVFTEDTLLTMDSAIKAQLVSRLSEFSEVQAVNAIIALIKKDRSLLMPEEFGLDLDSLEDDIAAPPESELFEIEALDSNNEAGGTDAGTTDSDSLDSLDSFEDNDLEADSDSEVLILTVNGQDYTVSKAEYESLSFIDKIKFKRALPAAFGPESKASE